MTSNQNVHCTSLSLCPHQDAKQHLWFKRKPIVCHLKVRHKRNCSEHRPCYSKLCHLLDILEEENEQWIQSSLLASKKSLLATISSRLCYWEFRDLTGTYKLSVNPLQTSQDFSQQRRWACCKHWFDNTSSPESAPGLAQS